MAKELCVWIEGLGREVRERQFLFFLKITNSIKSF